MDAWVPCALSTVKDKHCGTLWIRQRSQQRVCRRTWKLCMLVL
jgi:hypothetical protein